MRPLIAVFAHPDDEAFGPAGTLALMAKERDVYLVCVTNGDAGDNNSDKTEAIDKIRREELHASAKALGIKEVIFLGFHDGTLSNSIYHEVAAKLKEVIERLQPEIIMTLEPRGISGHIDHVTVSMVTSYVFEHVDFINELWYFCLTQEERRVNAEKLGDYFIYLPPGYKKEDISKTIDVSPVWEQKVEAAVKHESQKPDVQAHLESYKMLPHEENFIILKKS